MIEVVVVIGIIGVLMAIAVPAVQSAREASRRMVCTANLRQLLIGINVYHDKFQSFPNAKGAPYINSSGPDGGYMHRQYSGFSQILNELDSSNLYNSINFNVGINDLFNIPGSRFVAGHESNQTVIRTSIALFVCPSDGHSGIEGPINYRLNLGSGLDYARANGPLSHDTRTVSPRDIRDGLSNVAMCSEKLTGDIGGGSFMRDRAVTIGGILGTLNSNHDNLTYCAKVGHLGSQFTNKTGLSWMIGTYTHTTYNHIAPPNSQIQDCGIMSDPAIGIFAARSSHGTCVGVGMADGSVRFVANTISPKVWEALGTRAGAEIVNEDY